MVSGRAAIGPATWPELAIQWSCTLPQSGGCATLQAGAGCTECSALGCPSCTMASPAQGCSPSLPLLLWPAYRCNKSCTLLAAVRCPARLHAPLVRCQYGCHAVLPTSRFRSDMPDLPAEPVSAAISDSLPELGSATQTADGNGSQRLRPAGNRFQRVGNC